MDQLLCKIISLDRTIHPHGTITSLPIHLQAFRGITLGDNPNIDSQNALVSKAAKASHSVNFQFFLPHPLTNFLLALRVRNQKLAAEYMELIQHKICKMILAPNFRIRQVISNTQLLPLCPSSPTFSFCASLCPRRSGPIILLPSFHHFSPTDSDISQMGRLQHCKPLVDRVQAQTR